MNLNNYKKYDVVTLSASKINLYYDCPRKYFFRYLFNWPLDIVIDEVVWPGTGFGEIIHKILENSIILKNDKNNEDKDIIEKAEKSFKPLYDNWLEKNKDKFKKSSGYSYKKFIKKGEKYSKLLTSFVLKYFENFHKLMPEFKFDIEYDFVDDVKIRGIIDLIFFMNENSYELIDFKTTKDSNKFYFTNWKMDTQSLMYIYYAWKSFGRFPEGFDYLILNHELNTLFFKSFDIKDKQKTEKLFKGLTLQIKEVRDYTNNPDFNYANPEQQKCHWCDYKEHCDKRYKSDLRKLLKKIRK